MNGGPDGDLYITFLIANHPEFKRLGNDLYTTVDLDYIRQCSAAKSLSVRWMESETESQA